MNCFPTVLGQSGSTNSRGNSVSVECVHACPRPFNLYLLWTKEKLLSELLLLAYFSKSLFLCPIHTLFYWLLDFHCKAMWFGQLCSLLNIATLLLCKSCTKKAVPVPFSPTRSCLSLHKICFPCPFDCSSIWGEVGFGLLLAVQRCYHMPTIFLTLPLSLYKYRFFWWHLQA